MILRITSYRTGAGDVHIKMVGDIEAAISIARQLCEATSDVRVDYLTEDNRMVFTFYGRTGI